MSQVLYSTTGRSATWVSCTAVPNMPRAGGTTLSLTPPRRQTSSSSASSVSSTSSVATITRSTPARRRSAPASSSLATGPTTSTWMSANSSSLRRVRVGERAGADDERALGGSAAARARGRGRGARTPTRRSAGEAERARRSRARRTGVSATRMSVATVPRAGPDERGSGSSSIVRWRSERWSRS